jgi:predicted P-loop ATPase
VIEINKPIDNNGLRDDRDRIWRAAVLAYRARRLPILSPLAQVESERRNLGYAPEHPWLALLLRWMPSAPSEFTSDQALIGSGCVGENRIERKHQNEVAPLLKSLGFTRDQHQSRADGGARPRLWRRVAQPVSTSADGVETDQTPGQQDDSAPLSQPLNLNTESFERHEKGGNGAENSHEFPKEVETLRHPAPPEHLTQRLMELRCANPAMPANTLAHLLNAPGVIGRDVKEWLPWIDAALDEFNEPAAEAA